MAYRSSTRGGSRGSARGGSSRTAPSTNMAAYAFAAVALVAVVVVLVVAMGGKDAPPVEKADVGVSTAQPVAPVASKPAEKPAAPYPPVSDALITKAKNLVKTFEAPAAEGNRLYDEALKAKQAGNDKLWQQKMEEARDKFIGIQDAWNEIIAEMPKSKDYDEEMVANHVLGHEGNQVNKYLTTLEAIRKTLRLH